MIGIRLQLEQCVPDKETVTYAPLTGVGGHEGSGMEGNTFYTHLKSGNFPLLLPVFLLENGASAVQCGEEARCTYDKGLSPYFRRQLKYNSPIRLHSGGIILVMAVGFTINEFLRIEPKPSRKAYLVV